MRGLTVDGSEDKDRVREFIAGLRLLRLYGRVASCALRDIRSGKGVSDILPLLERRGSSRNGRYELSTVPVHSSVPVPVLPDYSALGVKVERMKDDNGVFDRGYLVYLMSEATVALAVLPHGRVRLVAFGQGVGDGVIGSVRPTKNGCAWSFSNAGTKRTQTAVREALAKSCSRILVKLSHGNDITDDLGQSKAKQVHETLRLRAEAKVLLDGHAERFRRDVEALLTVDAVHEL